MHALLLVCPLSLRPAASFESTCSHGMQTLPLRLSIDLAAQSSEGTAPWAHCLQDSQGTQHLPGLAVSGNGAYIKESIGTMQIPEA